ncbi:MAG TPA: DNA ligase D [Dyella sp.]|uniref:DNA ligase D n=1 Tax=Dyella sp. TaxID=1869338 RepID=UPI002D7819A7|nr:DNA ligase D [Dyella sp.]HET6554854.1 DNA ligase D [Dyella sp.]
MSLREYHRKRDFSQTREPKATGRAGSQPIFVVQLHHARRRHFDFRLQVGKTLKSWAVPKGPSFDPEVKRLAVEVEDHPLSYANFEGDIPEGNYGAGHVDCFDRGVWSTEGDPVAQLRKGHLEFELDGTRLHGRWHLVRSHRKERQPAWFLIKGKDEFAGKLEADDLLDAKLSRSTAASGHVAKTASKTGKVTAKKTPSTKHVDGARKASITTAFFAPELTQLRDHLPPGDDWLHEIKWDGYRILTAVVGDDIQCWSRNALPWSGRIPDIVEAIRALGVTSARFDGELVAMEHGRSDFSLLQKILSGERRGRLSYMLFDLIHLDGQDLSHVALQERKALLHKLLARVKGGPASLLGYSEHVAGHGEEVLAMVEKSNLEGVVSKRADSAYRAGRSGDWLKVKRLESDEFAIVGYTPGKGSRQGFGSLLLGRPSPKGGWDYAGRVGSGFSDTQLRDLGKALAESPPAPKPSVHEDTIDPLLRHARWVRPHAVVEVYYRGLGGNGLLRQPSLKSLREDKPVRGLRDADRPASARKPARSTAATGTTIRGIAISHPDREVFPGITKLEVAQYYDAVMDAFLPGVKGRPLSILRCPAGIGSQCFFQKHPMRGLTQVDQVTLAESSGAARTYLSPSDAASVIELVQFGAIEFHPWGGLAKAPDRADRLVFDLDPAEDVAWRRVVSAARLVRKLLGQLALESFVRTTGGKGLHVVVPLRPAAAWDKVEAFARAFAMSLAASRPDEFIAVATKARRGGLIFVDYLRNSRGATSVASYSLRARAGATVAVPLRWEELGKLTGPASFDIRTTPARLRRQRRDPWEGIDDVRQTLAGALRALSRGK